jgi:hypothetical protein
MLLHVSATTNHLQENHLPRNKFIINAVQDVHSFVCLFVCLFLSFFLSFFLSYSDLFLPNPCTWLPLHMIILHYTHTHTHTHTLGRSPLYEGSDSHRDLYLTTHNIHKRQISMPPTGFDPVIPATERP